MRRANRNRACIPRCRTLHRNPWAACHMWWNKRLRHKMRRITGQVWACHRHQRRHIRVPGCTRTCHLLRCRIHRRHWRPFRVLRRIRVLCPIQVPLLIPVQRLTPVPRPIRVPHPIPVQVIHRCHIPQEEEWVCRACPCHMRHYQAVQHHKAIHRCQCHRHHRPMRLPKMKSRP